MTDNKNKKDGRDDSKIDSNDSSEVSYVAKKLGVTSNEVKEAIKAVGNSRDKVEKYLGGK